MTAFDIGPVESMAFLHLLFTLAMTAAIAFMLWYAGRLKTRRASRGDAV